MLNLNMAMEIQIFQNKNKNLEIFSLSSTFYIRVAKSFFPIFVFLSLQFLVMYFKGGLHVTFV